MTDEPKVLDLSAKSFEEFVDFFFSRAWVPDDEQFRYFSSDPAGEKYDEAVPSSPVVVVRYMTKLFLEFGRIANNYSLPQIDQGVWGILGENLRLYEFVFDASVPLPSRLECIHSMFYVFPDFVVRLEAEPDESLGGFFMWWDLLLHGFWMPPKEYFPGTYRGDASKLDAESRALLDAMFRTLTRILNVPNRYVQRCALHGLGHLHHPGVRDAVQTYIDSNKSDFQLSWLENCRDGIVL